MFSSRFRSKLAQLRQINRMRFANVLCVSSDIDRVPRLAFETIGPDNRLIKCPKFMLNLDLWTENVPPTVKSVDILQTIETLL